MPTNQVARNTVPYNDISDDTYLDFTTQPSPKWSGISPESMEYNGDVSHARFLIQPVSEPNQTYNEGRTEATVHRMPANKKVFKTNHDKSLDDLECRIYQALKNAGLNVPGVQRETEGFVMDYAGSTSFIDHAYYNLWPICSELDIKNLMDMGIEMAHLISIFDYVASNEIGAEDKERLRNMASAKVAAKFNVPNQTAHERYFMFRMLEAVPHADQETVKLLQPIEDMMTHALDRYPSWTVDVHPGNLFPNFTSHKFDDFVGIDFNRMKYGPMQMAESFAFDKPLLCGGFNGRALALQWGDILTAKTSDGRQGVNFQANVFSSISPVLFAERKFGIYSDRHTARALRDLVANKGLRNVTRKDVNSLLGHNSNGTIYSTSPWDELTRRALTGKRLRKHQELTGLCVDDGQGEVLVDYAFSRLGVRVYVNLSQARYALEETLQATDYQTLFNKFLTTQHHLNLIVYNLETMGRDLEDPDMYRPLIEHVVDRYTKVAAQIPAEITARAEQWFNSPTWPI